MHNTGYGAFNRNILPPMVLSLDLVDMVTWITEIGLAIDAAAG